MTDAAAATLIALDWGTSSARAYLLGAGGAVLDARRAPLGLQHVAERGFAAALGQLLGDWAGLAVPRIACGMVGSRQGWIEAPYRACPLRVDSLGEQVVRTPHGELSIVGGLTCRDRAGVPDVMRGEETQLAGLPDEAMARALVLLPGTHSKWVRIEAGRIETFATYMTGETYDVLTTASLLGRMMVPASGFDAAAFRLGAERGLADGPAGELLHRIFAARTLALFDELAGGAIADYLSGLLIGAEVAAGRAWAEASAERSPTVWLIGAAALCVRYTRALEQAGLSVRQGPDDVAARGLWRIARRAGIVTDSKASKANP